MFPCRHDLFRIDTANVKDDTMMGLKQKLQGKKEKTKPKYTKLYVYDCICILHIF